MNAEAKSAESCRGLHSPVEALLDARARALMDRVEIVADRALGPYEEPELEMRGRNGQVT